MMVSMGRASVNRTNTALSPRICTAEPQVTGIQSMAKGTKACRWRWAKSRRRLTKTTSGRTQTARFDLTDTAWFCPIVTGQCCCICRVRRPYRLSTSRHFASWVQFAPATPKLGKGIATAMVSITCWELFAAQPVKTQAPALGHAPRLAIEAASFFGRQEWLSQSNHFIGINGFGAPATDLARPS